MTVFKEGKPVEGTTRTRTPRATIQRRRWARHQWKKSSHMSMKDLLRLVECGFVSQASVYGQVTRVVL